ncbi:PREDICTED: putative fasciclin-like arabinogalactan protein 20 [Ipomoea nil]|uniref:putative fasciclin-like arabinogalactan protein 20 n=1 Tax=Ipomoea nil TaxID=35883 RepID=UPI0009014474|nr:PREDICTED: putative fasciclin-like arabinogalactan protein 20 [Ipomoea nil]
MAFSKSFSLATAVAVAVVGLFSFSVAQIHTSQSQALTNAVDTLSDSGYIAMSLTIELIAETLIHSTDDTITTLTIFSPPDSIFAAVGQPSLRHLLLHFSPLALSISALSSLPLGSEIPNLSPSSSLYISASSSSSDDSHVSINGVKISTSPIFDDGSVIVFTVDDFFAANFTPPVPAPINPSSLHIPDCKLRQFSMLNVASAVLKSRGYSIMASFLDLQLLGFMNTPPINLTVFAPVDGALIQFSGDLMVYQLVLMRHVLPCALNWTELNELGRGSGAAFQDYVKQFSMNVRSANGEVFVNGIRISIPDMYHNDWVVIHGLNEMIPLPDEFGIRTESTLKNRSYIEVSPSLDL